MSRIDTLLAAAMEKIGSMRRLPESTYRLQFHAGFTFRDAIAILPYLRELGITHVYASPYFKARPGSTHGYDVIDHNQLNPEIGSEADYEAFLDALRQQRLQHILDTVPNHMGVGTNENVMWNDALEFGRNSDYAGVFDIAWRGTPNPRLHDKVLLPVLGDMYGNVLEKGELRLAFENGSFAVYYYDRRFPVAPETYAMILRGDVGESQQRADAASDVTTDVGSALADVLVVAETASAEADPTKRTDGFAALKRRLAELATSNESVRQLIDARIKLVNGTPGEPRSFDRLDDLLNRQHYVLAFWRVAPDEINYRRFFDINDLAALCMERESVFEAAHAKIMSWLAEGKIAGLRIDHPDGLFDPKEYFLRLQRSYLRAVAQNLAKSHGPTLRFPGVPEEGVTQKSVEQWTPTGITGPLRWPLYVVAEKILAAGEPLPEDWAVYGTSGYDFLIVLNNLFVDQSNAQAFTRFYHEWIGDATAYEDIVYQKKRLILQISLASELQMLAHQLHELAQSDRHWRDFTLRGLHDALREIIACFPVYRSYISDEGVHELDERYIDKAVRQAMERNPKMSPAGLDFVRDTLILKNAHDSSNPARAAQVRFAGKFQQVTAPVTAKGIEDTAFYVYNRLVSLNEVGGEPGRFGMPADEVHGYFASRQRRWPHALSCLSTHDTKRSEDVRARINVLSEIPEEWRRAVARWSRLNEPHRARVDQLVAPGPNEEYLLYQTLVGAWPLEPYSAETYADFVKRIQAYMEKALREAKVHTSWTTPNVEYDKAIKQFVARVLDEGQSAAFIQDLRGFQRRISHFGLFNSLSQTLLRLTAPGAPDTYQGTELWDFSLVDPDNRRAVDYAHRQAVLADLRARTQRDGADLTSLARELLASKEDGRIKMYVTMRALACREKPGLFSIGDYLPIEVIGTKQDHVFGFVRQHGPMRALVVTPRFFTRLTPDLAQPPVGAEVWGDTRIRWAAEPGVQWTNVFTGERVESATEGNVAELPAHRVFSSFPFALLTATAS